jgi:hypothetical protein
MSMGYFSVSISEVIRTATFSHRFQCGSGAVSKALCPAHLPALGHGSSMNGQARTIFSDKPGTEKLAHDFPFGAGYAGTEVGVHGKDQLKSHQAG